MQVSSYYKNLTQSIEGIIFDDDEHAHVGAQYLVFFEPHDSSGIEIFDRMIKQMQDSKEAFIRWQMEHGIS